LLVEITVFTVDKGPEKPVQTMKIHKHIKLAHCSSNISALCCNNTKNKKFWEELTAFFPFTKNWVSDTISGAELCHVHTGKSIKQ
jgi:hypothetical protein